MNPEKLIYTFVSYASHYNTSWGQGTPVDGVERTAGIAHRHGIPVTWIVNGGSIPVLADRIRDWHDRYGDDVILQCPAYGVETRKVKAELKEVLEKEWDMLEAAFPWVKTKVAGRGFITGEVIETLEELGFQGMWGYCWEQFWWDGITHRGIPWGSWYVDGSRYKVPHPERGKIVACEWTARDLNLSFHTGSPCIYSTDPNDVLRAGLCTGDDITYWKHLFDDYLRNTANNANVFFVQQQESHEMEVGERFAVWPESHVEASDRMLDSFFRYVREHPVTLTTLPEAVRLYHDTYDHTAPSYMLTRGSPIRAEINEYTMTLAGVGIGPWPETFQYYDAQCQMAFVQGENRPRRLRSYIGKSNMEDDFEEKIPPVFVTHYERSDRLIEIEYEIGYTNPMPFGLAYWDDLAGFGVQSVQGASEAKLIQDKLVFLRFDLTGVKQQVRVVLHKNPS